MTDFNRKGVLHFLNAAPFIVNLNSALVILIAKRLEISAIELKALLNTLTTAK